MTGAEHQLAASRHTIARKRRETGHGTRRRRGRAGEIHPTADGIKGLARPV